MKIPNQSEWKITKLQSPHKPYAISDRETGEVICEIYVSNKYDAEKIAKRIALTPTLVSFVKFTLDTIKTPIKDTESGKELEKLSEIIDTL
tara:strand:+ start:2814 stop:3086 length:273 start_codon:yes stop_codon:yes gene_type:complete